MALEIRLYRARIRVTYTGVPVYVTINRSRKVVCASESILLTENTAIIERTVSTFKPHVMMHHMQIAGGLMG